MRQETEAIKTILAAFQADRWLWVASEILMNEVKKIRDLTQRDETMGMLQSAHQTVSVGAVEGARGKQLEAFGFKPYDALHIACAESGKADVFLTTDDQLISSAKRHSSRLRVRVENPHTWIQEMTTMNQNQLREEEQDEQERQRRKAEFRARLDRVFAFKGGKGNYTEERHQQPMPDIDTIVKEIIAAREAKPEAETQSPPEK